MTSRSSSYNGGYGGGYGGYGGGYGFGGGGFSFWWMISAGMLANYIYRCVVTAYCCLTRLASWAAPNLRLASVHSWRVETSVFSGAVGRI